MEEYRKIVPKEICAKCNKGIYHRVIAIWNGEKELYFHLECAPIVIDANNLIKIGG